MSQLPFPGQPSPSASNPGRIGGAYAAPAHVTYPARGAATSPSYTLPGNFAYSSATAPPLPLHASTTPLQPGHPPVPPPRRTASLPAPHVVPIATPTPTPPSADSAVAAFHRSLVAYYWHYAQQGFVAPLTAPEDSVERVQQERARTEAVEWARSCGITVVDPAGQAPNASTSAAAFSQPVVPVLTRERAMSRPLPAAPASTAAQQPVPPATSAHGCPLPARAVEAPPAAPAMATSSPRSPLPPTPSKSTRSAPSQPSRSTSLMNRPSPSTGTSPQSSDIPHSHGVSGVTRLPSTIGPASQKRPLPVPPLAQLADRLGETTVSSDPAGPGPAPPSVVPSIALPDEELTRPPIPSFSFDDDDCDGDAPSTAPAVPTFSIGCADDDGASAKPLAPPCRSAPLHPRHDPSHPSHKLYHPTSVLPTSPSASPASLGTSSARPEAGTLTCSACRALIFGRMLVALGREWHPDCFSCAEDGCGARLEVMEFEGTPEDWEDGDTEDRDALRGKAWCMVHFEERFALECHQCRTPIASADYLPITDALLPPREGYRSSATRYYHPLHFFCSGCGDPFVDPVSYELLPSTGAGAGAGGAALEARPYVPRDGHPYCDACDLRMWRPKCAGCRKGLREEDGFLEVEGQKWHEGCFLCSMCAKPLCGIYLLRRSPCAPAAADDEDVYERPYCAECYDVKAKEEAEQAVDAKRNR